MDHMDRGSSKHGPRLDDQMASETEGMVRSGMPQTTEEWKGPEPPADDDPDVLEHGDRATEEPESKESSSE